MVKNRVTLPGAEPYTAFHLFTQPTAQQQRAFDLLGIQPSRL